MATDVTLPPLRLRPHHFLCALGYQGKGYSAAFTANMSAIVIDKLRGPGGDTTPIQVTGHADDICTPCPKRRGNLCTSQTAIATLDRAHAVALKLKPRESLTWGQARTRIRENVQPGDLATLCQTCQWLDLGLCEAALSRLHSKT